MKRQIYKIKDVSSTDYSALGVEDIKLFVNETQENSGGGATNLGYTESPTNGIVTSDTGTDATIPLADVTNAGLLSPSFWSILNTFATSVRSTILTGLSTATATTILATDTVLEAFGKLQGQMNLKANLQNVEQIIRSKSNGTFGSHTGDTAETVIAVIDIDANDFEAGDWMTLLFSGEKDAVVGNITWRLRAGVNGNTSDSQIAILTATSSNSRYCALYRGRPQFLTGNQLRIWAAISSVPTDIAVSGAPSLASLNPTSAWKLTVTAQLTVSTEIASLTGYRIGKIKSF